MPETNLVQIQPFTILGEDERGLTSELCLPRKQDNFIFITRKSGSLSGNTWHEGKIPATNPKIIVLLTGTILLSYRKIDSDNKQQLTITAPATIEISPRVTHNVEAISDCTLLECNSILDIQDDRHREDV